MFRRARGAWTGDNLASGFGLKPGPEQNTQGTFVFRDIWVKATTHSGSDKNSLLFLWLPATTPWSVRLFISNSKYKAFFIKGFKMKESKTLMSCSGCIQTISRFFCLIEKKADLSGKHSLIHFLKRGKFLCILIQWLVSWTEIKENAKYDKSVWTKFPFRILSPRKTLQLRGNN